MTLSELGAEYARTARALRERIGRVEEELEAVIARAKEVGAIVIVDEAYHYFYDKTFLPYALKDRRLSLSFQN